MDNTAAVHAHGAGGTTGLYKFVPKVKYKKAPQAPRRFKSAYIFFSTTKHKEIRAELTLNAQEGGRKMKTTEVAKLVSKAWKALSGLERQKWDDLEKQDRIRYEKEKLTYTGPWKVRVIPVTTDSAAIRGREKGSQSLKSRPQRPYGQQQQSSALDVTLSLPSAPTRPLSAFLSFSNSKRLLFDRKNIYNKEHGLERIETLEMSRSLAQLWIDATLEERKLFVDEEFLARQRYKKEMVEWKKQQRQQGIQDSKQNHIDEHKHEQDHEYGEHAVDGMFSNNISTMSTSPMTSNIDTTTSSATSVYSSEMAASIFASSSSTSSVSDHLSQLNPTTNTSNPHPHYNSDLSQQHNSGISSNSAALPHPADAYSNQEYQRQQQNYSQHYYNNHATASSYYNDTRKNDKYDDTTSSYNSSAYNNQYNYNPTAKYNGDTGGQHQEQYPYGYNAPAPSAYYHHQQQQQDYSSSTAGEQQRQQEYQYQQQLLEFS